jgi:acetyl esterase
VLAGPRQQNPSPATSREATPVALADAEAFVYREIGPETLRLHVFKPPQWTKSDRRAAFVIFFGGDWVHGTPLHVAGWTRWAAAALGLVGIAPDYRTATRHGTSPLDAVVDARAAVQWVQQHASELGVDPTRIIVGGDSAGAFLALWTALSRTPPGRIESEALAFKPAALILTSPVSDTSPKTGYASERLGDFAKALSPVHQLEPRMPPVLIVHGDLDRIVPYVQSTRLRHALLSTGNACELITVRGGTHNFGGEMPEWRDKLRTHIQKFLREHELLP